VGEANRFEGVVAGGRFTSGGVILPADGVADGKAVGFVRPHDLVLDASGFEARVNRVHVQGPLAMVDGVTADGARIEVTVARDQAEDFTGSVKLSARKAHVFPG
jgi:sulfate transport system ATP-binding protein